MASNVLMRFGKPSPDGVPPGYFESGECTVNGYQDKQKGWIEVNDCSFTIESESSSDRGTGSSGSPATLSEFSFSHFYDSAAPLITSNFVTGTPFSRVQIDFLKPTGSKTGSAFAVYCRLIGVTAYITKVTNKSDEDGKIEQEVELKCKGLVLAYRPQSNDGSFDKEAQKIFTRDFIGLSRNLIPQVSINLTQEV